MKKVLALVLAFMMIFSSISFTFADTTTEISAAKACETLGMLQGSGTGVTAEYLAGESTRLQAAIMVLRLMGLEKEAVAYVSDKNFADMATYAWADGKNVAGYLLAHPELGFVGDGVNFMPNAKVDEAQYYKVMLTALGYTQDVDYTWAEVTTFAKSLGFAPQAPASFTNNDIARITMEALQAKNKAGVVLFKALIAAEKMTEAKAIEAGLIVPVTAALDTVTAIGNTVVEVVFDGDVEAADAALYTIDGLTVKSALAAGSDTVRLTTDAMTAGKLYTLTFNDEKAKFTGVAKVSGTPEISAVESKDIEEVKVTFTKDMDLATATDVANYAIAGVEIVSAELDGDTVTLTTAGLVAKKQYTVKVTNVRSIDGSLMKSDSQSFYTRPDTSAPTVSSVTAETNERVVIVFNEEVTKASAENVANYVIKTGTTELAITKAELVQDDDDFWTTVELTTEPQKANARYSIVIENIADDTNAANTMAKAVTKYFYGKKADEVEPTLNTKPVAISKNNILVSFKDASDFDEATLLDVNNYELTQGSDTLTVESASKVYFSSDVYMVNLVVEDMDLGSYALEMTNISDEFGNVMDDKKSYFTVTRDSYASAKVKSYKVTGENEMVIYFDKPVVKATAIDLANYSFDEDLGAPVELAYSTSSYKVTITTNDFVYGTEYELAIAGVEDLAGNVLDFSFDFTAAYGTATAPELNSVYAVNKNVVALAFDDEIDTFAGAQLVLRPEGATTNANDITLTAKALTEDNTVVEFSDYTSNTVNVALAPDTTYFVYDVTGTITGLGGAAFDKTEAGLDNYLVYGTDETPERAEVLNVEQIDGVSFEVTMSKNVKAVNATPVDEKNTKAFDLTTDDDVATFTIDTLKIAEDAEYVFDLSALLTDEHGVAVLDQDENEDSTTNVKTTLYAEYLDEENPYILNVVAVDRYTVEVEYSEAMGGVATYDIENADEDINTNYTVTVNPSVDIDDEIVTLHVTPALEGRYDYKLIIGTGNATDLAGNPDEEIANDEFYFTGTDLSPVAPIDLTAPVFVTGYPKTLDNDTILVMSNEDGKAYFNVGTAATAPGKGQDFITLTANVAASSLPYYIAYNGTTITGIWVVLEDADGNLSSEKFVPYTAVAPGEGDGQPSGILSVAENSAGTELYVTFTRPVYIYKYGGYDPEDVDMWDFNDSSAEGVQIQSVNLSSNHLVATVILSSNVGIGDTIEVGDFHTIDMRCFGYPRTATRDAAGTWTIGSQANRAMGAESNHISE